MAQVIFSIPEPEFKTIIRDAVLNAISEIAPQQQPTNKTPDLKTRKETSEILGISLVTLNEWTKTGIIKGLRIGNRVRYRMSDIENALHEIQVYKRRGA